MANYLRPRRGQKSTAESQAVVLKEGEIFFEIGNAGTPTTGSNAVAFGKIKMGDGSTTYSNLGYFIDVDTTQVDWDNTGYSSATSADQGEDLYGNLNAISPTATIKSIFGNIKALLYKLATKVTTLNTKVIPLDNKVTSLDAKVTEAVSTIDDKLDSTGGTITGDLIIGNSASIIPKEDNINANLGSSTSKFNTIYTNKISGKDGISADIYGEQINLLNTIPNNHFDILNNLDQKYVHLIQLIAVQSGTNQYANINVSFILINGIYKPLTESQIISALTGKWIRTLSGTFISYYNDELSNIGTMTQITYDYYEGTRYIMFQTCTSGSYEDYEAIILGYPFEGHNKFVDTVITDFYRHWSDPG